jgi:Plasmid stabilisation system protein.
MGCYSIEWKTSAKKDLRKIDKQKIPKILEAVENLALNPHPSNHKKSSELNITTEYVSVIIG